MAGRGGAGNIEAKNRQISKDLEESRSAAEDNADPSPVEQALRNERPERTIATSGRGGAGNTYNPSALTQEGGFSGAEGPERPGPSSHESVHPMTGRGGAGNYIPTATEGQDIDPMPGREQRRASRSLSKIETEVEAGLAKPQPAHLSPVEKDIPQLERR